MRSLSIKRQWSSKKNIKRELLLKGKILSSKDFTASPEPGGMVYYVSKQSKLAAIAVNLKRIATLASASNS
jgi:hypothetical protein